MTSATRDKAGWKDEKGTSGTREKEREGESKREAKERERREATERRVQTRQLRTRPKTAIKSPGKQTTFPFCRSRGSIVLTIIGTPSRDFTREKDRLLTLPSFWLSDSFLCSDSPAFDLRPGNDADDARTVVVPSAAVRFDRISQRPLCGSPVRRCQPCSER